jgi:hypothetical protein
MPKSRYTEKEAANILKRAAKLQDESLAPAGDPEGIEVHQLEQIAKEAGIELKYLHAALEAPRESSSKVAFGFGEKYERIFDGELSQSEIEEALSEVGSQVTIRPVPHIGKGLRFHIVKGFVFATAEITSQKGVTKLKVRHIPFISYFAGLHGPAILAIVLGANFWARSEWIWGTVAFGLSAILGIALFTVFSNLGKAQARPIVDALAEPLAEAIGRHKARDPNQSLPEAERQVLTQGQA